MIQIVGVYYPLFNLTNKEYKEVLEYFEPYLENEVKTLREKQHLKDEWSILQELMVHAKAVGWRPYTDMQGHWAWVKILHKQEISEISDECSVYYVTQAITDGHLMELALQLQTMPTYEDFVTFHAVWNDECANFELKLND